MSETIEITIKFKSEGTYRKVVFSVHKDISFDDFLNAIQDNAGVQIVNQQLLYRGMALTEGNWSVGSPRMVIIIVGDCKPTVYGQLHASEFWENSEMVALGSLFDRDIIDIGLSNKSETEQESFFKLAFPEEIFDDPNFFNMIKENGRWLRGHNEAERRRSIWSILSELIGTQGYIPDKSTAAVVVAAPQPMGSDSGESVQEADILIVNTNESSSSSNSSQAVMQEQTVALVSPRVEVTPENILIPSLQFVDQVASTSCTSSSLFTTAMSSHQQASSSNTVTTSQAGHKRPRDADGDSSNGVEESSASEKKSLQKKRTRVDEQIFQGVTESGLEVEYQVQTSSQSDKEYDVVAADSEDKEDEGMKDDPEVNVDDSSNVPNQSSAIAADVIELSVSGQQNQQIKTISGGSDAGSSSQANPLQQAQRQQQPIKDDSIVPSTPTLYVARRADGFNEAISSPYPTVPHGSRFTFAESGRAGQSMNVVESMDATRVDLNLLEGSGDGGQSSSSTLAGNQHADNVVNDQSIEPIAGPSSQAPGSQIPLAKKKRKTDDEVEVEVVSAEGGSDGVSSEGEKAPAAERVQVEDDREAEASVLPRNTR